MIMNIEYVLYQRLLAHSECVVIRPLALDMNYPDEQCISAIEIANYGNGENLAIECVRCNEVIIDIDRPHHGGE